MPGFYAASDICVLPTWREGLPNVALEAAAMQIPIVATNTPGCIDAIEHGVTGILVEARNPESLKAGLRLLLEDADLRSRMGENGRRFVTERFAESEVSNRLSEEYRRLLDGVL
jgi:glycosyltransferase involved in cell wall biosynthesis